MVLSSTYKTVGITRTTIYSLKIISKKLHTGKVGKVGKHIVIVISYIGKKREIYVGKSYSVLFIKHQQI